MTTPEIARAADTVAEAKLELDRLSAVRQTIALRIVAAVLQRVGITQTNPTRLESLSVLRSEHLQDAASGIDVQIAENKETLLAIGVSSDAPRSGMQHLFAIAGNESIDVPVSSNLRWVCNRLGHRTFTGFQSGECKTKSELTASLLELRRQLEALAKEPSVELGYFSSPNFPTSPDYMNARGTAAEHAVERVKTVIEIVDNAPHAFWNMFAAGKTRAYSDAAYETIGESKDRSNDGHRPHIQQVRDANKTLDELRRLEILHFEALERAKVLEDTWYDVINGTLEEPTAEERYVATLAKRYFDGSVGAILVAAEDAIVAHRDLRERVTSGADLGLERSRQLVTQINLGK